MDSDSLLKIFHFHKLNFQVRDHFKMATNGLGSTFSNGHFMLKFEFYKIIKHLIKKKNSFFIKSKFFSNFLVEISDCEITLKWRQMRSGRHFQTAISCLDFNFMKHSNTPLKSRILLLPQIVNAKFLEVRGEASEAFQKREDEGVAWSPLRICPYHINLIEGFNWAQCQPILEINIVHGALNSFIHSLSEIEPPTRQQQFNKHAHTIVYKWGNETYYLLAYSIALWKKTLLAFIIIFFFKFLLLIQFISWKRTRRRWKKKMLEESDFFW